MYETETTAFVIHPRMAGAISYLSPRDRWKLKRHKERWERRYRKSYVLAKMRVGAIEGVRWIMTERH